MFAKNLACAIGVAACALTTLAQQSKPGNHRHPRLARRDHHHRPALQPHVLHRAVLAPRAPPQITGRNHHSVGFGVIAEQATGFPGYDSVIGLDNATIGRILRDNGYATSRGSARTTTRRPTRPARSGRSTSGRPAWASSTSTASSAATPTSGGRTCSATRRRSIRGGVTRRSDPKAETGRGRAWNLITAMADDAIDWMTRIHQTTRASPIFMHYVPGATHAPHHPDEGVGGQDRRDAPLRRRLREAARDGSSRTSRSSA